MNIDENDVVIGEEKANIETEKADINKEKPAIRDLESFEGRLNDRHLTKPTITAIRKLRDARLGSVAPIPHGEIRMRECV